MLMLIKSGNLILDKFRKFFKNFIKNKNILLYFKIEYILKLNIF